MVRFFTEKKYKREMLRRMIITFLIVILAFFSGGLSFYYSVQRGVPQTEINYIFKKDSNSGSYEQGYKAALDLARKKVQEKGMLFPVGQASGISNATVKSVSGNSIVVEFDASVLDFFAEGKLTKTVMVPDTVTIQQNIPKPIEDYQKEENAYHKKINSLNAKNEAGETIDSENIQLPTPYTIKELEVKDLKAGDLISILTSADVSKADTIEATNIIAAYIPTEINNLNENTVNVNP